MPDFPENYPYNNEKPVIIKGKILNQLISTAYGLEITNGDVVFNEGSTKCTVKEPRITTVIKPTEKLDTTALTTDASSELSGTGFYKGNIYANGAFTDSSTEQGALIFAFSEDGSEVTGELTIGNYISAIPIEQTLRVGDLRDLGFTPGVDLEDNNYVVWIVYYVMHTPSTSQEVPVKTIGGSDNGEYRVNIYANGKHNSSTGLGVLEVLNLNISEEIPVGTWLMAHATALTETGGA